MSFPHNHIVTRYSLVMRAFALCYLLAFRLARASSFYDNPEQDILYNEAALDQGGGLDWADDKEELERRWGNDVRLVLLFSLPCLLYPD